MEFIGKTIKRLNKLPLLVVGYDKKTGRYVTKQLWSDSHSRPWLDKNLVAGKIKVGSVITLLGNKKFEVTKIHPEGHCQLVYPDVILYTADELQELQAEHHLGDELRSDQRAPTMFRTSTNFAWRSQSGSRR